MFKLICVNIFSKRWLDGWPWWCWRRRGEENNCGKEIAFCMATSISTQIPDQFVYYAFDMMRLCMMSVRRKKKEASTGTKQGKKKVVDTENMSGTICDYFVIIRLFLQHLLAFFCCCCNISTDFIRLNEIRQFRFLSHTYTLFIFALKLQITTKVVI